MGLLDFDIGKIANNDAFTLGMGILGNNTGHYGQFGPAMQGGLQDYQRQKALQAEQAQAQQEAEQQQAQMVYQQKKMEQEQLKYQKEQAQQLAQQQWLAKNKPKIAGAPKFIQQAAIKAQYPSAPSFGTTPHFTPQGDSYQLSSSGGARKINVPLQKPLHFLNTGAQQFGANPITGEANSPIYENQLKPSEEPDYKANVKTQVDIAANRVKKDAGRTKVENALSSQRDKTVLLKGLIDKSYEDAGPLTTGFIGQKTQDNALFPAHDMKQTLATIKANIGFDRLQEMRDNSVTGGALGQVSEMENKLLQAVWGNLEQSQGEPQFKENLRKVEAQVEASWERMLNAYEADYGVPYAGKTPSTTKPQSQANETKTIGNQTFIKINGEWFQQ